MADVNRGGGQRAGVVPGVLRRLRRRPATTPTRFQALWHGPPLGALRKACLRSFVDAGHQLHLFTYEPVDVPAGVTLVDANEVIPLDEVFYFDNPRTGEGDLGPFSDLFRFRLLMMRGGWWTDVDTLCVSRAIPQLDQAWAREMTETGGVHIGSSQIAMRAGDDLPRELYERCLALSKTTSYVREALGPHLLSSVIAEADLPHDVGGTTNTFYPVRWIEMFKLWLPEFTPEIAARAAGAWFLPIYQSFASYLGLDPTRLPPTGSYLHGACMTHGAAPDSGQVHSAEDVRERTREFFRRESDWAIAELVAVSGDRTVAQLGI